jgi:hypothetical protein
VAGNGVSGLFELVGNVETKRLTDRHLRYNQMHPALRQRKTGAHANQDTQGIVSDT